MNATNSIDEINKTNEIEVFSDLDHFDNSKIKSDTQIDLCFTLAVHVFTRAINDGYSLDDSHIIAETFRVGCSIGLSYML